MKRARRIRTRLLVATVSIALAALAALCGCESPTGPETGAEPSVTLSFSRAAGIAAADSVVVKVFRARGGLEAVKGVAISNDVADVRVSVACSPEKGKRVSVELFEAGLMTHHGATIDVAVVAGRRTSVDVDVYDFVVSALSVTPSVVQEGESFQLSWDGAPAASLYRVQASTAANFNTIEWDSLVADTTLKATEPPGGHYFRVAPHTVYAQGTYTPVQGGFVVGVGAPTWIDTPPPTATPAWSTSRRRAKLPPP